MKGGAEGCRGRRRQRPRNTSIANYYTHPAWRGYEVPIRPNNAKPPQRLTTSVGNARRVKDADARREVKADEGATSKSNQDTPRMGERRLGAPRGTRGACPRNEGIAESSDRAISSNRRSVAEPIAAACEGASGAGSRGETEARAERDEKTEGRPLRLFAAGWSVATTRSGKRQKGAPTNRSPKGA